MRAARFCGKSLGISVPIAVDTMDNATWKAFGKSMNAAYLIGTDGKIILQQGLCEPKGIREALKKVTGR